MNKGVATFTLDYGKCPPWLFRRMVKLGREMTEVLISEFGPNEYIKRIADPVWFQSLGTVLAFDWNASGLTTILTAALKEAIRGQENKYGVFICGGKGKSSLKTPDEILNWGDKLGMAESYTNNLIYNSKTSAKVDSSLIQDGFDLYHHAFFFTKQGSWTVVQQGMNKQNRTARRYHWHSQNIKDLIIEPHSGIASQKLLNNPVLNMTSKKSDENRLISTELVNSSYNSVIKDINLLRKFSSSTTKMVSLQLNRDNYTVAKFENTEFKTHSVQHEDFSKSKYLEKILAQVIEKKPKTYEEFVTMRGVGPKTVRALSLVAELIYGAKASYTDPARYSFAHGGKDATPYPVDTKTYDETIEILKKAVQKTKLPYYEKNKALEKLSKK
ncbi:hypothetical protein COV24_03720 [candidate division WWE3 bacterium CG10_big_fil_rev_8_21_14_0_10_32_10]|uniref:DUF763 domain-containing protein n=1 Tax=candidate division WWE3 bacterium CG10_big_fil_rev_8_21_14_0_10_32_10 TaxID=1975090 RepID=A0A2H0R9M5_UNCKA|nr:MAG: hypothetical protein COV24_03720 [candidate division WWE3 bacterium CG10_big_fil_rev_8_21_14_0_10_32_10]